MHTIYVIFNTKNSKCYVGKTRYELVKRWKAHIRIANSKSAKYHFHLAIKKHGVESFIPSILAFCKTEEDATSEEKFWIKKLNSNNRIFGYNMSDGGESHHYHPTSIETRLKMSNTKKGKKFTEEHKRKLSESGKGKHDHKLEKHPGWGSKRTPEQRKNISDSLIGKMAGERNPRWGAVLSQETRDKISQANKKTAIGHVSSLAKLKLDDVICIKKNWHNKPVDQTKRQFCEIHSVLFVVSAQCIDGIIRQKTWVHVTID